MRNSEIRSCLSRHFMLLCNVLVLQIFSSCCCTEELRTPAQVSSNVRLFSQDSHQRSAHDSLEKFRFTGSRRLLISKHRYWYSPCTSVSYKLQMEHLSCAFQHVRTSHLGIPGSECPVLLTAAVLLGVACLGLLTLLCTEKPKRKEITNETIKQRSVQETLRASLPEEISYRTLRKITNNFSSVLGDGGFGLVYNGEFKDGDRVAVKVLDRSLNQGEKEFRAEVFMMATTQHVNVMPLRGFCTEGSHRILVYEFMPNASLDKWIFKASEAKFGTLDWPARYNIGIGAARGLAYLHEERPHPIMHLDVKPENILLDVNFTPKLADFGLSRIISKNQSRVVTKTRGTPGYLAPEWVNRSSITTKVDVFSFGMVLLELVCGREVINMGLGPEQWYLPAWVVHMVEEGKTIDVVDPIILEEVQYFYDDQIRRVVDVALCCIQEDPALRPKMSRAVQMLEGVIEAKSPISTKKIAINASSAYLNAKMDAYMSAIAGGISDVSLGNSESSSKISNGQTTSLLL